MQIRIFLIFDKPLAVQSFFPQKDNRANRTIIEQENNREKPRIRNFFYRQV
jgi:hypothetical protein